MRDREQLLATIKDFVAGDESSDAQQTSRATRAAPRGLIGGDVRRVASRVPQPIAGPGAVDTMRDPASVKAFLTAATRAGRVRLEVGAARGTFAVPMALRNPGDVLLASEVRRSQCRAILRRRTRRRIDNLYVMVGDIRLHLPGLLPGEPVFDEVYVLFPDPWWKRRHRKRRLFQPSFFDLMACAIAPGGFLAVKSDVAEYLEHVRDLASGVRTFEAAEPGVQQSVIADLPPTGRERELLAAQLPIGSMVLTRTEAAPPAIEED